MKFSIPVAAGFIVVALFLIWHEKSRQKRIDQEYDEMQLRFRAKGAWYAFYAMILFMAVYLILESSGFSLLTAADALFLGAVVCGSVNVGYSILHDSYYGLNRTGGRNILFIGLIAIMEIVSVCMLVRMAAEGCFADLTPTIRDDRILIVLPTDLSGLEIEPEMDYCTLVTCTPYGINTHRLLVRGHRTENEEMERIIKVVADATQIDPRLMIPVFAAPLLLVLFVGMMIVTGRRKRRSPKG